MISIHYSTCATPVLKLFTITHYVCRYSSFTLVSQPRAASSQATEI